MDLDVAVERRLGILEPEVALSAPEQRHEDLAEVLAHLGERLEEELARGDVDLADGLHQRLLGHREIVALRGEEVETLELLLVLLDGERVHRAERLEVLAQLCDFGAEGVVVDLHGRGGREHLLERAPPLGLQSLTDRRPPPRQLGQAELGVVQLLGDLRGVPARVVERVLGALEARVGLGHAPLGGGQPILAIAERCLTRLELELPLRHPLGERAVGVLDVRQLGQQRLEPRARRGRLLGEPPLAIGRHLHARFHLRALDLLPRAGVARALQLTLAFAEGLTSGRRLLLALRERGGVPAQDLVDAHQPLDERAAPLFQAIHHRAELRQLALGALDPALELAQVLFGSAKARLRRAPRLRRRDGRGVRLLERDARCIGRLRRALARGGAFLEGRAQLRQLGAPAQGTGTGHRTRQPHGPARVDERGAAVQRLDAPEQGVHPAAYRRRGVHLRGERPACLLGLTRRGIEREQQQRSGIHGRMPRPDLLRRRPVPHHDRMNRRAEEALDRERRPGACRDEVADRAEHGA